MIADAARADITATIGDIVTLASTSSKNLTNPAAVTGPVPFFFLCEGKLPPTQEVT